MVYPLLQRWFHRLRKGCSRTGGESSGSNLQLSSRVASSKSKTKSSDRKRFQHPLSIPNDTAWGSDGNVYNRIYSLVSSLANSLLDRYEILIYSFFHLK